MAVAPAGLHAYYLQLAPDPPQHLIIYIFTGRMVFLMPNPKCQSTEGRPRCPVVSTRALQPQLDAISEVCGLLSATDYRQMATEKLIRLLNEFLHIAALPAHMHLQELSSNTETRLG